jgi:hypothetical protein
MRDSIVLFVVNYIKEGEIGRTYSTHGPKISSKDLGLKWRIILKQISKW